VDEAATRIREEVDPEANIILGATFDEKLEGTMRVSVVATGLAEEAIPASTATIPPSIRGSMTTNWRSRPSSGARRTEPFRCRLATPCHGPACRRMTPAALRATVTLPPVWRFIRTCRECKGVIAG
jgi:cell division protein FtsZ